MLRLAKKYFLKGLECRRKLYLSFHKPELAAEPDAGSRDRMEIGLAVGALAREEYPGGVLVDARGDDALFRTQELLSAEVPAVFEATLEADGLLCKVDVLVNKGDSWEVHEVKSSKVKRSARGQPQHKAAHLDDIGFQLLVAQKSGLDISDAQLVLLDGAYRRGVPGTMFEWLPVLDAVGDRIEDFEAKAPEFLEVLEGEEPHELVDGRCKSCEFLDYCFAKAGHDDVDDIIRLSRARAQDLRRWREAGVHRLTDLPLSELKDNQQHAHQAVSSGTVFVRPHLANELARFKEPIYFLDFEAASFVPPHYEGTAPYEVIPFQWSCHITDIQGDVIAHREFLHRGEADPRPEFARSLEQLLKEAATVVVYSPYEQTRVNDMDGLGLASPFLSELFRDPTRVIDLLDIVRDNVYHPLFKGSFSIKTVLPALVEKPLYDDLEIADGATAAVEFKRMVATGGETADRIAANLLAYCKVDTLAMVEVYRKLRDLAGLA